MQFENLSSMWVPGFARPACQQFSQDSGEIFQAKFSIERMIRGPSEMHRVPSDCPNKSGIRR